MQHNSSPLNFEYAIRQFLGNEADHIADHLHDDILFRKWLRKCLTVVKKRMLKMDTTSRHKEMLLNEVGKLDSLLKSRKGGSEKEIIIALYWLMSRLLGLDAVSGKIYNEPFYHQTYGQFFLELASWKNSGKGWSDIDNEIHQNTITGQRDVYTYLKKKNLSDNEIAKILNTTELQIKKLKHGL